MLSEASLWHTGYWYVFTTFRFRQECKFMRIMSKEVYGKKRVPHHRNMSDESYFSVVNKIKIFTWSSVDVFLHMSSYDQISKLFCFTIYSYLLVKREIPSRIFGSHPSEYDENLSSTVLRWNIKHRLAFQKKSLTSMLYQIWFHEQFQLNDVKSILWNHAVYWNVGWFPKGGG